MDDYIGLDVSLKETAISVRRDGKRIWRGKCPSDPDLLSEVIRKRAPMAKRVVFETGPLSVWFFHALAALTQPCVVVTWPLAKAALALRLKKNGKEAANRTAATPTSISTAIDVCIAGSPPRNSLGLRGLRRAAKPTIPRKTSMTGPIKAEWPLRASNKTGFTGMAAMTLPRLAMAAMGPGCVKTLSIDSNCTR